MDVELKNKGNQAFQAGNFDEAVKLFSEAIAINPNNHVYFSNRSGAYASLENYEKALEDAEKCIEINPSWAKGYARKGFAQFYMNDIEGAKQTYEKGLELDSNNVQLKEGVERCQSKMGSRASTGQDQFIQQMMMKLMTNPKTAGYMQDPAFVAKLQAIQQNPQAAGMYMNDPKIQEAFQVMLGDMMGGANMPGATNMGSPSGDSSQPQGQQQSQMEQEIAKEQERQEQIRKQKEQEEQAKAQQKKQQEAEKKVTERDLGNQAYKKKDFKNALVHYEKAFQQDNKDVLALNNMAAVYIEMGDLEKAMEQCDRAIKSIEDNMIFDYIKKSKVFARKASIYAKQKKYAESVEFYEKSLLEDNVYKVKEEMKQVQKLKKAYDNEMYIDPAKAEEHNELGKGHFKNGDFVKAMKEYEEAIRRNPKDPKLYSNKGICLMKLMDFSNALTAIQKCLELDPQNVKAYAKQGNCHFAMKEYHKALSSFEKGLKIDSNNSECKEGISKTQMKMYGYGETKEEAEQRAAHGMADPEIQMILRDPSVMNVLRGLQENPKDPNNLAAMRDPTIAEKINKLIAAGILKMG